VSGSFRACPAQREKREKKVEKPDRAAKNQRGADERGAKKKEGAKEIKAAYPGTTPRKEKKGILATRERSKI